MLGLLQQYAVDSGLVAEPGFAPKMVKWALRFDNSGRYIGLLELGDASDKKNPGRSFAACPDLRQNELVGGSETRSHFLVDSLQVIGLVFKDQDDERTRVRVAGRRGFFVRLLRQSGEKLPELRMLAAALDDASVLERIQDDLACSRAKLTDKATLAISDGINGDHFPVESSEWHPWWREFRAGLNGASDGDSAGMRCFITGEVSEPLLTHPKINGLRTVGGLAMGDALVCSDKDAFASYGLEQSANCAVCEEAASGYRAALNYLIAQSGPPVGGAMIVHWYSREIEPEDDWCAAIKHPGERFIQGATKAAADTLQAIREGTKPRLGEAFFYSMTISGAGGRVMVRNWQEGRFENLVESAGKWFADLEITRLQGDLPVSEPPLGRLVECLLRPRTRDQDYASWIDSVKHFGVSFWLAALNQLVPIPGGAIARTVGLNSRFMQTGKLEEALDPTSRDCGLLRAMLYRRMALIKAYHIRKDGGDNQVTTYLNEDHPNPAYHCGRIMAMLRRAQWMALGRVGAGVVQRYYGAASATPGLIMGRLVSLSQHHLAKIDGKYPGLGKWYNDRIAEVWARIQDNVPPTLTLSDQSLFALGYYQQIAFDNNRKAEKERGVTDDELQAIDEEENNEDA